MEQSEESVLTWISQVVFDLEAGLMNVQSEDHPAGYKENAWQDRNGGDHCNQSISKIDG